MPGSDSLKYFFGNVAAPYSPGTIRGVWDQTTGYIDRKLVLNRIDNGDSDSLAISESNAYTDFDVLIARFISDPLTVDFHFSKDLLVDTATIIIGANEYLSSSNNYLHYHVYVTQESSNLRRGTLLTDAIHSDEISQSSRGISYTGDLSNVAARIGDRIVVEVGYRAKNIISSSQYSTIYFGSTGLPDLAGGSTNVTTEPGTITFTGTEFLYSSSSSSRSSSSSSFSSSSRSSNSSSSSSSSLSSSSSSSNSQRTLKYFLGNAVASYYPSSIRGNWEDRMNYVDRKLVTNRADNGVSATNTISMCGNRQANYRVLFGRFVSDALSQNISFDASDYITIIAGAKENNNATNAYLQYYMYVTQGNSNNVRGVIFNNTGHSAELTTTARGWSYTNNCIGFNALAGDRIVLEIGYNIKYGPNFPIHNNTTLYYGGTEVTDLTNGDTNVTINPGTITLEYLL